MKFQSVVLGAVLFLLSCQSSSEHSEGETSEETNVVSVLGKEIQYQADTVTMHGYLAYDENQSGPRPGVLVVHEWWGHNDYARSRADMLAEQGYVALAVDMYGDGKTASHPDDAGKFASMVMQNMDGAKARFESAMKVLQADPHCEGSKLAAIGYCFGGGVVLNMALQGMNLKGVASFHGSLPTPEEVDGGQIKAAMLVCHGADDPFISAETVELFRAKMKGADVDLRFEAYPGAVHSFTSPAADSLGKKFDMPVAYDASADQKSWAALQEFLDRIFNS